MLNRRTFVSSCVAALASIPTLLRAKPVEPRKPYILPSVEVFNSFQPQSPPSCRFRDWSVLLVTDWVQEGPPGYLCVGRFRVHGKEDSLYILDPDGYPDKCQLEAMLWRLDLPVEYMEELHGPWWDRPYDGFSSTLERSEYFAKPPEAYFTVGKRKYYVAFKRAVGYHDRLEFTCLLLALHKPGRTVTS